MRPRIAILATRQDNVKNNESPDKANLDLSIALALVGSEQYWVTPESPQKKLNEIQPHGIVLPGGDFVFPNEYYLSKSFYPGIVGERFNTYKISMDYSIKTGTPLLGICAGMQILGAYLGGKITPTVNHRHTDKQYAHTVKTCGILDKIAGQSRELNVNSSHNEMLVGNSLSYFNVLAESKDGVIEAIEPRMKWANFVLGLQWHPEKLAMTDQKQMMIFAAFVKAARQRM